MEDSKYRYPKRRLVFKKKTNSSLSTHLLEYDVMIAHAGLEIGLRAIPRCVSVLAHYPPVRLRGNRGRLRPAVANAEIQNSRTEDLEVAANGQGEHRPDRVRGDAGQPDARHTEQLHRVRDLVVRSPMERNR